MAWIRPLKVLVSAFAVLLFFFCPLSAAAGDGSIVLEADRVEYDQASGFAVATGRVRISRDLIRVFAPRIEYSAVNHTIEAFSDADSRVVLFHGAQRLEGELLTLDMISGEGLFRNASGSFPAEKGEIHASGADVTTIRIKEGQRLESVPGRIQKGLVEGDQVYRWSDVGFTTCSTDTPHYQLVSKRLVVIPGYRVVASKPAIYVGGKHLLSYPFDYVIDLSEGSRTQFLPQVMYEGDKGLGVSFGAPLVMGDVNARWKAILWSEVDFEGALSLDYKATENIRLFAEGWYSWDDDENEKRFRPQWGADYDFGGWTGRIWWSQAESVTVEKELGDTFEGTLWRDPEFTFFSPRWDIQGLMGSWQLSGVWGDYETRSSTDSDTVSIQRSGLGANYSGSAELGDTSPFWDVSYWWYDYGSGDGTQKITTVKLGLKWPLGPVSMTSLWRKRWVDGGSPMAWDDYSDSEVFYQKAAIPFGEHWSFTVRGGYDLRESSLDEMYYQLSYENTCCFRVDLAYRDDRVGDDDWAGLVFVLDAFPSHPFFLGAREIEEFVE
ncbi:MAG: hypothetical protein QM449_04390 [Synergistota bacterium]|nr:hypothetical protein [Synergistota bacterium]